jgi:hypothetical protein
MPNKAVAAGGSITFAGACAMLIIKLWWHDADADTAVYLTTFIAGVLGFASVYLTPHN